MFKFDSRSIEKHVNRKLKGFKKALEAAQFVAAALITSGNFIELKSLKKISLIKLKELSNEGKSYNWSVIKYKSIHFVIREYGNHLTIYCFYQGEKYGRPAMKNFVFESYVNTRNSDLSDDDADTLNDELYDNPFIPLESTLPKIVELIEEDRVWLISNEASVKVPKHIKFTLSYDSSEEQRIHSYDNTFFAFEEIATIQAQLYAETVMFDYLKENAESLIGLSMSVNGTKRITEVKTELKNGYYHDVGVSFEGDDEKTFKDVYSLNRWYHDEIMQIEPTVVPPKFHELAKQAKAIIGYLREKKPAMVKPLCDALATLDAIKLDACLDSIYEKDSTAAMLSFLSPKD